MINADEEVVNKYRYTPFGSPRLKVESVYNPYQYTGRRLDDETGQYYYRARMYSAEQSRFTTQDPSGMQEGPNMYAYVGNNPVNKRDPSGMVEEGGEESLPGGPPPEMIDGGGAGDPYIPCPDGPWESIDECIDFQTGPNAIEECHDLCGGGSDGVSFDMDKFADCITSKFYGWGKTDAKCIGAGIASSAVGCWLSSAAYFGCLVGMIEWVVWKCTLVRELGM